MKLLEYVNHGDKEDFYEFYEKLIKKPKEYQKVTRKEMVDSILATYKNDPEIILSLCSVEEISVLKSFINESNVRNTGYIEYLLFKNLKENFLLIKVDGEYQIPEDILNYIKMALNLLEEEKFSFLDVMDSVIIGLVRIYNVIELDELMDLLKEYHVEFETNIKDYIKNHPKFYHLMKLTKKKNITYVVSKEFPYYEDILNLQKKDMPRKHYTLEETISFGKYKINLFNGEVFNYLSFLEMHLESEYVSQVLEDLVVYMGFDLNNEELLGKITDNIEELKKETKKVLPYFPIWIYNGNTLVDLKISDNESIKRE